MESEIRFSSNTMDGIKGSDGMKKLWKHADDKSIPETNSSHLKIDASVGRLISFLAIPSRRELACSFQGWQ